VLAEVDPVTLVVTIIEVSAALGIVWLASPRRREGNDTPAPWALKRGPGDDNRSSAGR
jgi:hypothetical protein